MIREAINELDWRTYMNAAKKDKNGRSQKFKDAARNSFMDKYNTKMDTTKHRILYRPNGRYGDGIQYSTGPFDDKNGKYSDPGTVQTSGYWSKSSNNDTYVDDEINRIKQAAPRNQYRTAIDDFKKYNDHASYYDKDEHIWKDKNYDDDYYPEYDNYNDDYEDNNVNKQQNNNKCNYY